MHLNLLDTCSNQREPFLYVYIYKYIILAPLHTAIIHDSASKKAFQINSK